MNVENKESDKKSNVIEVTVPIREKKEYCLDNGMIIEKWQKISEKTFKVDSSQVTLEQSEKIKNGPETIWWGVAKLPRQTPFGIEEVPFHFSINGETIEEVAGNYEERLEESLEDLERKIKKQQNKIIPANPADLCALEKNTSHNSGIIF